MVAVDLVAGLQGGGAWSTAPSGCLTYNTKKADLEVDNKVPYLCTGYDFYMTHEPCTMCAMALVHSRVRRVFYAQPSEGGALGTCRKLHVQPGLNHHFQVWSHLVPKHTGSAWEELG